MSAIGTWPTSHSTRRMSAIGGTTDIAKLGLTSAFDPSLPSASISCCSSEAALPDAIKVGSPSFGNGEQILSRYTADGEGLSPPLEWSAIPADVAALVLLVEDADAPSLKPLVHCIVVGLPPAKGKLAEGELQSGATSASGAQLGKNSFMTEGWLPPDPPPGHGLHRYVFQMFALSRRPDFARTPGRRAVVEACRKHGVSKGVFIGTYKRD